MTSKQDRKCMGNKSIDRRVALRLNSWQSGALGKLWGFRLAGIGYRYRERLNQRYPACCATHPIVVWGLKLYVRAKRFYTSTVLVFFLLYEAIVRSQ